MKRFLTLIVLVVSLVALAVPAFAGKIKTKSDNYGIIANREWVDMISEIGRIGIKFYDATGQKNHQVNDWQSFNVKDAGIDH